MRRRTLTTLIAGAAVGLAAAPAQADLIDLGPDLTQTGPSTVTFNDPNDVLWWAGTPGVEVPAQGEIRAIKIKGGTQQTAEQRARATAFDPNYDITHWLVLRPQPDGSLKVVSSSEDVRLPIVGMNGVTDQTITTIRQPQDNYRVCALPGDRVALASVGGYVPTNDAAGRPVAGFERGLPYQVFARTPQSSVNEFLGGGMIPLDSTVRGTELQGAQLNMQAVLGTGTDSRATCNPAGTPSTPGGGGGGGGPTTPAVKVPMASPLMRKRTLGKDRKVPVSVTCRADGGPCSGTIELRVHKKRIALGKYAGLAPGKTGTYKVKLSKKGVYYVNADSDRKMLTTVVVQATGGRSAGGKMYILPRKAKRAK
jgi:hypothetical protein